MFHPASDKALLVETAINQEAVLRVIAILVALYVLTYGSAQAKTYQLTFKGKPLLAVPGTNEPPVPGATSVTITVQFPSSEAGTCVGGKINGADIYWTDGANTDASLTSAGYVLNTGNSGLGVCTSANGHESGGWTFYATYAQPGQSGGFYQLISTNSARKMGKVKVFDSDVSIPSMSSGYESGAAKGKWSFSIVK